MTPTPRDAAPSDSSVSDTPVLPPIFPSFDWIRVKMPIVANEMTIWPGPKETRWEWVEGFPFELHPFAWDYLRICCDGYLVQIEPHYLDSTWDTFWTNGSGHVKAQAMGGLFPYTLGKQVQLLQGIVATLEALPPLIADEHPDDASKIQQIHGILKTREPLAAVGPDQTAGLSRLRRSTSDAVWRWKVRRLNRKSASGGSAER